MSQRERLLAEFDEAERHRVQFWSSKPALRAGRQAAGIDSGHTVNWVSPVGVVDVKTNWYRDAVVLEVDGDPLVYIQAADTDEGEPRIHAIGPCRACGGSVPLKPRIRPDEDGLWDYPAPREFARVLATGRPAGHPCPGARFQDG